MLFNSLFYKYLLDKKFADKPLNEALIRAKQNNNPLFLELVKNNTFEEEKIYQELASFLGLEYRLVQLTEIDLDLVNEFPREKLIEYQAVPYNIEDNCLTFICANPFRIENILELRRYKNLDFNYLICAPSQVDNMLSYIDNKAQQSQVLNDYNENKTDITEVKSDDVNIDAPVIKLCDSLLKEAVSRKASDIHIEPLEHIINVRYRLDGVLNLIDQIPIEMYPAILARFKIMAEMNIAERRIPQDGKINLEINGIKYDFRVSTLPTINGEKIVIRIYNNNYSNTNLGNLGLNEEEQEIINQMITRPHGIVLLTGPTGSGKSTTLYAFLRILNTEESNIITVEDPVENVIPGINQVQVNPKANLTFANALRSILRQDPNIIMIGEIRDEETAQIATRAAITGHLVLSSIHTNDAAGVVTRLINMGVPRYLVADSLLGSISQRLVRRLCPKCKEAHVTTKAEMEMLNLDKEATIYEHKGCPYCNNTGYYGRLGIFEIMVIDEQVRNLIMDDNFTSDKLNNYLKTNMKSLLENAKNRVLAGETTIEEYEQLQDVVSVRS